MRDKINDSVRLELILEAIGNIESFLKDTNTCEAFESNKIMCHAVVYNLQCIGESVYKLSPEFVADHKEVDWSVIEGLRHVLVHDYYAVNMRTVWNVVQKDLPPLKQYLLTLFRTSV